MIGSGVASSLVHEVGHQGAALLDLVNSLQPVLRGLQRGTGDQPLVWGLWERWISEIVADLWAIARIGVASTMGLMGVVSLPRPFVFRINMDDPHPIPWIRVKMSCAIGQALYPQPAWNVLANVWEMYYPKDRLSADQRRLIDTVEASIPSFVTLLIHHRPPALNGLSLREALCSSDRSPSALRRWKTAGTPPYKMLRALAPTLAFALIGQARVDGTMGPEEESRLLGLLLTHWAMKSTLDTSDLCLRQISERAMAYPV
jgi:hypothetical protein